MKKILLFLLLFLTSVQSIAQVAASANGTAAVSGVISGSQMSLLPSNSTSVTLSFTVTGAPATSSIQLESSTNAGVSYSVCGQASTITSGTGSITCTGNFDHVQVDITAFTGGTNPTIIWGEVATLPTGGSQDACSNNNVPKQTAQINITTATTTSIIAPITGAKIVICAIFMEGSGTTPTWQAEYGTGATCGTGTVTLTPAIPTIAAGQWLQIGGGGASIFQPTPVSQRWCIVTTGTPSYIGWVVFIQY